MNINILRNLSYGLYIVSTMDGHRPTGCIANSIMQITSSPATVAISINHDNYTNKCIKKFKRFGVSILAEKSTPGLIGQFGFQSGKTIDKFAGVSFEMNGQIPIITDTCGYFICKVIKTVETSTHTIFIGETQEGDLIGTHKPMTYAYYHDVIKGKSPKNAPTYYIEEASPTDDVVIYKCGVCGYEYEGSIPFEDLPSDYTCPICKQPKNIFSKKESDLSDSSTDAVSL